ncbi:MAG: RHS repeat domain-containing protein, partial [Thermodesulfovibrionales bacterium]
SVDVSRVKLGDFNGDGKTDILRLNGRGGPAQPMSIYFSTGDGFTGAIAGPSVYVDDDADHASVDVSRVKLGDFNGDGKTDIAYVHGWGSTEPMDIYLSTGNGFASPFEGPMVHVEDGFRRARRAMLRIQMSDFDGDGKTDITRIKGWGSSEPMAIFRSGGKFPDLLSSILNGLGGTYTISYKASSEYQNRLLPYILHTMSSIHTDDGLGNTYITKYTYSGGYHDFKEREFRGFQYATKTNPDGTIETTKFYQDTFRKGRPEYIEVKDPSGNVLSKTTYTWSNPSGTDPWAFVKLNRKRTDIIENGVTTAFTQEDYTYDDSNGNLLSTVTSGTDAESITTSTTYQNYGSWLWRPTKTTVTGSTSGKVRETYFGYQSGTGNMLYKEHWLDGGVNPKIEFTYDSYGNQKTIKDARGYITETDYDTTTYTYPVKITYPQTGGVRHIVEKGYDSRYGKPLWEKDENGNITYYTYDSFGRLKQVDYPDGGQKIINYHDFASPRNIVTNVKEDTAGNYIKKYEYFDGLNRSIQTITFGEGGKSIVTQTEYDSMGRIKSTKGPFFSEGVGYPKTPPSEYPWVETTYDYQGRPTKLKSPDSTYSIVSTTYTYSGLSTTLIDPDDKKKTEKKDYLDRIVEVKEYKSNKTIFTTKYTYNAAGDLITVKDHKLNTTTMIYDTLGRKIKMEDPDMGRWLYCYDPNGNLLRQMDAKGQIIMFEYDELNRVLTKRYYKANNPSLITENNLCITTDYKTLATEFPVTYTYDLTIPNGIGRLYSETNTQVTTTYEAYDEMGRVTMLKKSITGAPSSSYTTKKEYDLSGKLITVTYPDNEPVYYEYYTGTGLLKAVTKYNGMMYAEFTNYQPSGEIGKIIHPNGTSTTYIYDALSIRLQKMETYKNTTSLQKREYIYSKAGDITSIKDNQNNITYTYTYDNLHRLTKELNTGSYPTLIYKYDPLGNITKKILKDGTTVLSKLAYAYADTTHKHAISKITLTRSGVSTPYNFNYDANGNMTRGYDFTDLSNIATRQITYNADNMPVQVTHSRYGATTITYDAAGGRAKKVSPSGTTYYIGNHFEIINGTSTKYIFAGDIRIAKVTSSNTYYYHKDHLGSSTLMTDSSGNEVETTEYMPFGQMRVHTVSSITNYKYTDQEYDPETGLYYYGARYYDPVVGRFISADSIVQDPYDPQTLNRYSYARNNPLLYTDPSGQFFLEIIVGALIGAAIGGTVAAITEGDILQGMAMGAIGGAFIHPAAGYGFLATVIAGGAAGGMNAAIFGGDIGQGILYGAIGAAAGYGAGALPITNPTLQFVAQVASGGIVSGTITELMGGSFSQGFTAGAVGAVAGYGMSKLAQYIEDLNARKNVATGEMCIDKAQNSLETNERTAIGQTQNIKILGGTNEHIEVAEFFLFGRNPFFFRNVPRGIPPGDWWEWSEYNLPPQFYPKPLKPPIPWYFKPPEWRPEPPYIEPPYKENYGWT